MTDGMETQTKPLFLHQLLQITIAAILVISTLAFGGAFGPAIFATQALIFIGLLILSSYIFKRPTVLRACLPQHLILPGLLFFFFLIFVFIQTYFSLRVVEEQIPGTISFYTTYRAAWHTMFYGAFFLVCLVTLSSRDAISKIIWIYSPVCLFAALLGVYHRLTGAKTIYGTDFEGTSQPIFSLFPYSNNYGGFIALAFPLVIGLACYKFFKVYHLWKSESEPRLTHLVFRILKSGSFLLFLTGSLMVVSLIISHVRASVLGLGIIYLLLGIRLTFKRAARGMVFFILLTILIGAAAFTVPVLRQFVMEYDIENLYTRYLSGLDLLSLSVQQFMDRPLFGWGLGTYSLISPKYLHSQGQYFFESWTHYMRAGNNYIEFLSEVGIVGFVLLGLSLLILFLIPLVRGRSNEGVFIPIMRFQSIIALVSLSFMLFFETHLVVPAISFLFLIQLAILTQTSNPTFQHNQIWQVHTSTAKNIYKSIFLVSSILAISLFLFCGSVQQFRAYQYAHTHGYSFNHLEKSLEIEPENHRWWYRKTIAGFPRLPSYLRTKRDENAVVFDELSHRRAESLTSARKATELAPTHAPYWYTRANVQYMSGRYKEALVSYERAVEWAPKNYPYRLSLLARYLEEVEYSASAQERRKYYEKALELYYDLNADRDLTESKWRFRIINKNDMKRIRGFVQVIEKNDASEDLAIKTQPL